MTYKSGQDNQTDYYNGQKEGKISDEFVNKGLLDEDDSVLGTPLDGDKGSHLEDEFSTEFTFEDEIEDVELDEGDPTYQLIGWIAIISSILAFLFMPLLFGVIGITLGFFAKNRHYETLGNTAITLSIIAMVLRLFIIPFVQ